MTRHHHPWSRRASESLPAYQAFLVYRDMGPSRTLAGVKPGRRAPGRIGLWSVRHQWVARAIAWDDHLQAERDRVAIAQACLWEERRQQHCEDTFRVGQALMAKGRAMLAFPNQKTTRQVDGETVIIEPAGWTFATAIGLAKAGIELTAAALAAVALDPADLDEATLRAIVGDRDPVEENADGADFEAPRSPG